MTPTETTIEITLNGEQSEVAANASVADLVREIGLDPDAPRGIAVAINDEVVRKGDWNMRALSPGNRVEIITARQGG